MTAFRAHYLSTACRHGKCGQCRHTCKFCQEACRHTCHKDGGLVAPLGPHIYLSTACAHGEHEYCKAAAIPEGGLKLPVTCKYCEARCICSDCEHPPEYHWDQLDDVLKAHFRQMIESLPGPTPEMRARLIERMKEDRARESVDFVDAPEFVASLPGLTLDAQSCDPSLPTSLSPVEHNYEYIDDEYGSLAQGGSYEVLKCRVCGRVAYRQLPD